MAPSPNLPAELTSFIGRRQELAEARKLLTVSRLLTITGAAGCGKTRLALRLALESGPQHADGVNWIELASLSDPLLLPKALAKNLNIAEQQDRPLLDGILQALQEKELLIVFDNCEHLRPACAQLVEALLALPGLRILATSREALGAPGETLYPLAPMVLPPAGLQVEEVGEFDAVQLFAERAHSLLPRFALNSENIAAVASICRQLDGIPLAIELASARLNVITVEQIAARLGEWYRLLGEAAQVTSSPHRTLKAALDWSYDLLTASERAVLLRLSVFAGGCSLAAAEEVCSGEGIAPHQVLELLASLIAKSLVLAQTLQRSEARYSMLETVRQYAREKLAAAGKAPAVRDRHLQHFLRLAEETLPKLSGPYQKLWLNWLEGEYDNLRAALAWSLEGDRREAGLRISLAIYQFWTIRDYAEEGLAWLERLLAQGDGPISPVVHANALAYAVFLAGFRGNRQAQAAFGRQAAELALTLDEADKPALRWALAAQAYSARAAGDHQMEYTTSNRVIQLNRELGDRFQLGVTLSINSFAAMSLGKYAEAHAMLDEALPLLREAGNPYRIAMALNFSGDLWRLEQNYSAALAAYQESVSLLRQLDAPRDLASALQNLGFTYLRRGNSLSARARMDEAMTIQQAQRNTPGIAECLLGFAGLAVAEGLPASGARLLAAARKIGGPHITSAWAATQMEYDRTLALTRRQLSESELQVEAAAGSAFSLDQAVAYAQALPSRPVTSETPARLTRREREIVALIALGKSNGAIAEGLVVSKRTIEKHVAHILLKLGLTNRAQLVRWAFESGVVRPTE